MPTLLDIAPSGETVEVWGTSLDITGLSSKGLVYLWQRFPQLQGLFDASKEVDAGALIEIAPDAISAIIAAGTGAPGCVATEALADKMPLDAQLDVLTAVMKVSMPQGAGPFVAKLMGLVGNLGEPSGELKDLASKLPAR